MVSEGLDKRRKEFCENNKKKKKRKTISVVLLGTLHSMIRAHVFFKFEKSEKLVQIFIDGGVFNVRISLRSLDVFGGVNLIDCISPYLL